MKKTFIAVACATLLVGASGARAQDQATPDYYGDQPSTGADNGFVGDDTEYVGDYGDFAVPVVQTGGYVGDLGAAISWDVGDEPSVLSDAEATAELEPQPIAPQPLAAETSHPYQPQVVGPIYQAVCKPAPKKWLRTETLLWFMQDRDVPRLVQVGDTLNAAVNSPSDMYGDEITTGIAPGFRLDYGHYLNDNFGLGAKVWGLFGEDDEYTAGGPPGVVVRPFFDTSLVNPNPPNPPNLPFNGDFNQFIVANPAANAAGNFISRSEFDMLATEVYGRLKLGSSNDYQIDIISGYSYFGLDDNLLLASNTTVGGVTTLDFRDEYDAENRFHGGQLGLETTINKGRWSFTSLTKVHLGNMNQRVTVDGFSQLTPGPVTSQANGFYIQGQQGVYEEDVFAFVPEMNFRLGYSPRSQVHVTLGYSFVYWSSVALAGDQVIPIVDGLNQQFVLDQPRPLGERYSIVDDSFWLQGIDMGVTFTF